MGSHHRQDQKHEADGSHQPGAGDVRPFVPQRRGRDLRQGLLRTALRHGRHRIPFLLRTVGLHPPRKRRVQRTDDHHLAGGIRPLGGRALQGTQRRRGDRPQRRQRLGGSHRNRLIDREVLQHERKRVRLVPGIGAQNLRNRALGEPVRLLRARLRRRARQDDRAQFRIQIRGRRRPERTDQLRPPATRQQPPDLDSADGRTDAAQTAAPARRAVEKPLVVVELRGLRSVGVHQLRPVGSLRKEPDRLPRQAALFAPAGARERRGFPLEDGRHLREVQNLHGPEKRCERAEDRLFQHGIRHPQLAENLFRRPRHPRGRLPQGGQRQKRTDDRRGAALPVRLLHAAPLGRRRPGGGL